MEESVDMEDKNVTIRALRKDTITQISHLLNPTKHFTSDNKLSRDWRGLAALCDIDNTALPNIQSSNNQVELILQNWFEKDKQNNTVQKFLDFLEKIDRCDVVEDVTHLIDEDVRLYHQNPNGYNPEPVNPKSEFEILTYDDDQRKALGQGPQIYDAFVLFADDDIDFATKLMKTMEDEYNLKFCSKDRDLVGGVFEHASIIRLITERCNRLVVVLTPAFLHSSQNKFLYSYAQSLDNSQRYRKIIPCTYKDVDLPSDYRIYFILDYRKAQSTALYDFWRKLYQSVKVTTYCAPTIQITPPNDAQISAAPSIQISLAPTENNLETLRSVLQQHTPTPLADDVVEVPTRSHDHHSVHFVEPAVETAPDETDIIEEVAPPSRGESEAGDASPAPTVKKKTRMSRIKKLFSGLHGHKRPKAATT
ncbi:unnamed protein product [Brassicogethes aeneus]|uniref:Myeloid differentiation primary response protein MyD88 n=1 Tax=Brassicogethes aeneus TaxID=1431903 RepID=A0A9P0B6M3_BRAAE|nr:unnamed protein product [Brassicogethes aeneus]